MGRWKEPLLRHHRFAFSDVLLVAVVRPAQDVISWQDAEKYYGQTKAAECTIVATRNTSKVCFLNFSPNWKTDFTAVVFAAATRSGGRAQLYEGPP